MFDTNSKIFRMLYGMQRQPLSFSLGMSEKCHESLTLCGVIAMPVHLALGLAVLTTKST